MTRSFDPVAARDTPPVAALPDRACAGVSTEVFFPEHPAHYPKAVAICDLCPHSAACLEWALDANQTFGVWGATTPMDRDEMRKEAA